MEQKILLNKEASELFTKDILTETFTTEKNINLKKGFIDSSLLWFSTYGIGASINHLNEYLAGGTMPAWESWKHPDNELFSGSFKWAFKSFSNFFGDWIVLGKTYAWSPGDLMLMGSFIIFIAYFSKTLYQYLKKDKEL